MCGRRHIPRYDSFFPVQNFADTKHIYIRLLFIQMAIRVTHRAILQMSKRGSNILFYCRTGGCNGLEYVLEPVKNVQHAEKQILSDSVNLWTCNKSMFHLLGTEIDWKDDKMGSRFVFKNPNANSMCGCGATFSTDLKMSI